MIPASQPGGRALRRPRPIQLAALLAAVTVPLVLTATLVAPDRARAPQVSRPPALLGVFTGMRTTAVAGVLPLSAAERAGIRAGDVVVAVDGEPVADPSAISRILARHAPGDRVVVRVERDGRSFDAPVVLGTAGPLPPAVLPR